MVHFPDDHPAVPDVPSDWPTTQITEPGGQSDATTPQAGKTRLITIPAEWLQDGLDPAAQHQLDQLLQPAAILLRTGGLVAFPTETVYGLGADARNPAAVASIFTAKGRPADNPLIVHIACIEDLDALTLAVTPLAKALFDAFSPGPLTLILPRSHQVPDIVTAGLDTVAVRIPAHPIARRLIELAGVPVAAPSANRSGRPSPTQAWHVLEDFDGRIPLVIDGGACEYGLESTVLDLSGESPVVLRPGAVTEEEIAALLAQLSAGCTKGEAAVTAQPTLAGEVQPDTQIDTRPETQTDIRPEAPRSPGMKYRHYAPKAHLLIADLSDLDARASALNRLVSQELDRLAAAGQLATPKTDSADDSSDSADRPAIGLYLSRQTQGRMVQDRDFARTNRSVIVRVYGETPDPRQAARHLFDALRSFDQMGVRTIIAEGLPSTGTGAAYMNRLRKAAGTGDLSPSGRKA